MTKTLINNLTSLLLIIQTDEWIAIDPVQDIVQRWERKTNRTDLQWDIFNFYNIIYNINYAYIQCIIYILKYTFFPFIKDSFKRQNGVTGNAKVEYDGPKVNLRWRTPSDSKIGNFPPLPPLIDVMSTYGGKQNKTSQSAINSCTVWSLKSLFTKVCNIYPKRAQNKT